MRIEDRGHRVEMASNQHLMPRRGSGNVRICPRCGVGILDAEKHAVQHARTDAKAPKRALQAQARKLLAPSRAERQAELRRKARAILASDDLTVMFTAQRRLNQLQNERSRMGFELFGDPDAFRS